MSLAYGALHQPVTAGAGITKMLNFLMWQDPPSLTQCRSHCRFNLIIRSLDKRGGLAGTVPEVDVMPKERADPTPVCILSTMQLFCRVRLAKACSIYFNLKSSDTEG